MGNLLGLKRVSVSDQIKKEDGQLVTFEGEKLSVSDTSEEKNDKLDVDDAIRRILSGGAKTPRDLKKAVINVIEVSERVYHRHLKRLVEKNEVEKVPRKNSAGRLILKYNLKEVPNEVIILPEWRPSVAGFSKKLWELVAWIRYSPGGWSCDDEEIEKAYVIIPLFRYSVDFPEVKKYHLDPDRYVYEWPQNFKRDLKIGCPLPRFFSLKTIYQAKLVGDVNEFELKDAPSFLGVKDFVDKDSAKRQIAVVVCRRPDDKLQVTRVEFNPYSSKQWVVALCKEHNARCLNVTSFTEEALVRRIVFRLDKVLKEKKLLIPSRYSLLLKDLRLFSFRYTPPPEPHNYDEKRMLQDYMETAGNFVHALAASVSCADR